MTGRVKAIIEEKNEVYSCPCGMSRVEYNVEYSNGILFLMPKSIRIG